jgi:hypothetical protein
LLTEIAENFEVTDYEKTDAETVTITDNAQNMVIWATIFFLIAILAYVLYLAVVKYPRSADATTPGNKSRRNKLLFGFMFSSYLWVPPIFFFIEQISGTTPELWWKPVVDTIVVITVVIAIVSNFVCVLEFSESISHDLLEHASEERVQEALKNNWTNTALVSALLFTIIAGAGMESRLEDSTKGAELKEQLGDTQDLVQVLYLLMVSLSFMEYLGSFLIASIHLMWTEALTADDAKEYYTDNPLAPASPMMWLCFGAMWHLIANCVQYFYTHEQYGLVYLIPVIFGVIYLYFEMRTASAWAPKRKTVSVTENRSKIVPDPE